MSEKSESKLIGGLVTAILIVFAAVALFATIETRHNVQGSQSSGLEVNSWTCNAPSGRASFVPLRGIQSADTARATLVREYVELERRRDKSTWEHSAIAILTQQSSLNRSASNVDEYKRRAGVIVDQANGGINTSTLPITEQVTQLREQFQAECKHRNDLLTRLVAEQKDLDALRLERLKPWLNENLHLPCLLVQSRSCKV